MWSRPSGKNARRTLRSAILEFGFFCHADPKIRKDNSVFGNAELSSNGFKKRKPRLSTRPGYRMRLSFTSDQLFQLA
jgi:hypothetical protein